MSTIKDHVGGKLNWDSNILFASVAIVGRLGGSEALLSLGPAGLRPAGKSDSIKGIAVRSLRNALLTLWTWDLFFFNRMS